MPTMIEPALSSDTRGRARPHERLSLRLLLQGIASRIASHGGVLNVVLVCGAAAYVAAFAVTGVARAIYPYTIDGLEPGALQQVRRILSGQPLYVPPQLEYVPMIYGPVYYYLAAGVAALSGSELLGIRLVSLLASLGSAGLIALLVRRETASLGIGLVGAGLFLACGPRLDLTMDTGRVDALSLFLLLGSICAARMATLEPTATWRWSVLSGALMGLALLTKQTGVVVALAVLLIFTLNGVHRLAGYVLPLGLVLGGGTSLLTLQSGQWPPFYLWQLPRGHEIRPELLTRFWSDLDSRFMLPVVVGPFYLFGRALAGDWRRVVFYTLITLALVGMAWVSNAVLGSGRNVQVTGYAAFALLFALGLHEALTRIRGFAEAASVRRYVLCAAIVQLAVMVYNPRLVVPYRSDLWAGQRLAATLAALPGPIFAPSYQSYLADPTAVSPDPDAITEVTGSTSGGGGTPEGVKNWDAQFSEALQAGRFTYIIVDPDIAAAVVTELATAYGYKDVGPLFPPGDIYWAWRTTWAPRAEVYARP
jgi:hypothetical protein